MRRTHIMFVCIYHAILFVGIFSYGTNSTNTIPIISLISFINLLSSFIYLGIPKHSRNIFTITIFVIISVTALTFAQIVPIFQINTINWLPVLEQNIVSTPTISVTPGDSMLALLKVGMPFSVFMASLIIFDDDERALHALNLVALVSGILSVLAILQFSLWPDTLISTKKMNYLTSLTGSFINRNTAGSFFGLGSLVIASIITFRILNRFRAEPIVNLYIMRNIKLPLFIYIFFLLSLLSALFLTQSRGAVITTFASISIFFVIIFAKNINEFNIFVRSYNSKLKVIASVLIFLTLIFFTLGSRVMLRAEIRDFEKENRFCIIPGILQASSDNWPFGAGIASFREVFPAYRNPDCGIRGVWDKAHNVYIQGILSFGLGFVLLFSISAFVLFNVYIHGMRTRKRLHFAGALGFATLTLALFHSAVDFSIQIPGFAIFFAAVCAPLVTLCTRR